MDLILETKKSNKIKYVAGGAVLILLILMIWLALNPNANMKVSASDIWTAEVKKGDLQKAVSGFGNLKSKETRLLTAYSNATVDEILLRPGAIVTPESVILKLFDPEIEQAVKTAERQLTRSKNEYLQLEINQQRALLSQKSEYEILTSQLESAELELNAQSKLIEQGIVSDIEYQRSRLEKRQLTRRVKIEKQRIGQLTELHIANLKIAKSNITAQKEALALVKQTQDRLIVKAGMSGVMQSLNVEIGQSVSAGQQLALVGSMTELYALINIAQSDMQQVALAQPVTIDTRLGQINGHVSRVEPRVVNGSIQVEVTLDGDLTDNARPELNISGTIFTGTLKNVLYIEKPINSSANSQSTVYRLEDEGKKALATQLQFGTETKDKIQILSGAKVNQRFILSDMSRWQEYAALSIVQ